MKKEIILNNQTWKQIDKIEAEKLFNQGQEIMFYGDSLKTQDLENEHIYYVFKSEQNETIEQYEKKYLEFYSHNVKKGFVYYVKTTINKIALLKECCSEIDNFQLKQMLIILINEAVKQNLINKKYNKLLASNVKNVILQKNDSMTDLNNPNLFKSEIRYKFVFDKETMFFIQFNKTVDNGCKFGLEKYSLDISLLGCQLDEILLV